MVLNVNVAVAVANVSADLCQYIACNPERLSSEQVLNLIFCLPIQQFSRFALTLWTYLCFSPPEPYLSSSSSDSSSSDPESDLDNLHLD